MTVPKPLVSKISVKSQTVLPKEVRERLGVGPGDSVRFVMEPRGVRIEKAFKPEQDVRFAAFCEWSTEADEDAFGDL